MDCIPGFQWPMPHAFLEAVSFCRFERGDILYDNPVVYELPWGQGKKHLAISLQVMAPEKQRGLADQDESVFDTNWASPITLAITNYEDGSITAVESTQGNLYTALRFADLSHLHKAAPKPPLGWKNLLSWLAKKHKADALATHPLGAAAAGMGCAHTFILAGDYGSPITRQKLANICEGLTAEKFDYRIQELPLVELKDADLQAYAPTARLYLFGVKTKAREKLSDALKRVLYRPNPKIKGGEERFALGRHGVLLDARRPSTKDMLCHSFVHGAFYRLRYSRRRCQSVDERFSSYIESIADDCPNDEFIKPPCCSDLCKRFSLSGPIRSSEQGPLSELWFNCPEERTFKSFHEHLQVHFLNADQKTVAVEIPVWVSLGESALLDPLIGLGTDDRNATLTGHIDLIRFEDGLIWVLDFKPNALGERYAIQQVYLYAHMLACRTGLPIEWFRCGYFDDWSAFAFDPSEMSMPSSRPTLSELRTARKPEKPVDYTFWVGGAVPTGKGLHQEKCGKLH